MAEHPPVTTEQWLLTAVSVSWSGWMTSLAVGKWIRKTETQTEQPVYRIAQLELHMASVDLIPLLLHRVKELESRMDQAGDKMSDLTDAVQGLPERLRGTFITRIEWDLTERRFAERRQSSAKTE